MTLPLVAPDAEYRSLYSRAGNLCTVSIFPGGFLVPINGETVIENERKASIKEFANNKLIHCINEQNNNNMKMKENVFQASL